MLTFNSGLIFSWTCNKLHRQFGCTLRVEQWTRLLSQNPHPYPLPPCSDSQSPTSKDSACADSITSCSPGQVLLLWAEQPSALKLWPRLCQYLVQELSWLLPTLCMSTRITAFLSGPLRRGALLLWLIMHQLINLLALVNWINYFKWLLIANICIITKDKSC